MKEISGNLSAQDRKFAIIAGRFNSLISEQLITGAIDALKRHGASEDEITIIRVPGAYEIPLTADRAAATGRFDAVICLGAVIRGGTPHFEYVSGEVAKGIAQVSLNRFLPVIFGVLTTDSMEQALERAGIKAGNHGFNAAVTAIEMCDLLPKID